MIQETFIGTKEVKGFIFKQVCEAKVYRIYEVTTTGSSTHFEVYRKKFNSFGEEIALASIYSTIDEEDGENRIKKALELAEKLCVGVRAPFHIYKNA